MSKENCDWCKHEGAWNEQCDECLAGISKFEPIERQVPTMAKLTPEQAITTLIGTEESPKNVMNMLVKIYDMSAKCEGMVVLLDSERNQIVDTIRSMAVQIQDMRNPLNCINGGQGHDGEPFCQLLDTYDCQNCLEWEVK